MYANDVEGWISPVELDWLYQAATRMKSIVEIGSYRGRSTTALCDGCQGNVTAVDIFKDKDFSIFKTNVKGKSNLTIWRGQSLEACKTFGLGSIDMVFIDGDHSYESVRDDIEAWLPKASKLICGHDYTDDGIGHWPGVIKAVTEIFGKKSKRVESIWFVDL